MEYELIANYEVATDEVKADPVVEKVLLDITQYQDGPLNIMIGDDVWLFKGVKIWRPKDGNPVSSWNTITYDANGDYFED